MKNTIINRSKNFKGIKVLVTGVGRYQKGSNNSAASFFVSHGAKVTITDPKTKKELLEGLKHLKGLKAVYHLGGYRRADFLAADIIIRNQGNREIEPHLKAALKAGKCVTTDVGAFLSLIPAVTTIGITGTRGKSTTTALLGEMVASDGCASFVGGNIKMSPLNFLENLWSVVEAGKCSAVVLELSSWLLEGWEKEGIAPTIAVVTNIFPDHLNTYNSYSDYIFAKSEIFRAQNSDGIVVLNRDNKETIKLAKVVRGRIFWFSKKPFKGMGVFVKNGKIIFKYAKEETVARISDIKHLKGEHCLENILAGVAAAKLAGVDNAAIIRTLRSFRGLPDRQEFIRSVKGVKYINDTTATSPDGVVAALRTFGKGRKKVVLIAGGKDKVLNFKEMAKEIKRTVKSLILFDGTASLKIINELKKIGFKYDLAPVVKDMKTAVKLAVGEVKKGDIVLLSPGAASFGLFKNEFDRGEQFVKAVKAL